MKRDSIIESWSGDEAHVTHLISLESGVAITGLLGNPRIRVPLPYDKVH